MRRDLSTSTHRPQMRSIANIYPAPTSHRRQCCPGANLDGRLFRSRRIQRTRIRAEIIEQAPPHPSGEAAVDDGMGEFSRRLLMRQRTSGFPPAQRHAARRRERWRDRRPADRGGAARRAPPTRCGARPPERMVPGSMPSGSCAPGRGPGAQRSGARSDRRVARRPDRTPVHDGRMAVDEVERVDRPWFARPRPASCRRSSARPRGCRAVLRDRDERARWSSALCRISRSGTAQRAGGAARRVLHAFGPVRGEWHLSHYAGLVEETSSGASRIWRVYEGADTPGSGIRSRRRCLDADGTLSPATGGHLHHIRKPAGPSGFEALPVADGWPSP